PKSLEVTAQQRLTPTVWHARYREAENFLLNMRLFRESRNRIESSGIVKEAIEEIKTFSQEAENYFLDVIRELIEEDVKESNKLEMDNLEKGTLPELANETREDVI